MEGGKPTYVDDDHISQHGAANVLAPKLIAPMLQLLGATGQTNRDGARSAF